MSSGNRGCRVSVRCRIMSSDWSVQWRAGKKERKICFLSVLSGAYFAAVWDFLLAYKRVKTAIIGNADMIFRTRFDTWQEAGL